MTKDLFRSVDYLATRQDIDMDRLGYYSLSMGAYFAAVPLSMEPRIKAAVVASGGLRFNWPAEIQPANFAPRVKIPVLFINGRNDFQAPLDSQARLYELFGTPAEHKRHVVLDGGHVPNDFRSFVREALDWFDRYLGRVE
jgi:dipeptidyl aminopeptidase/acylaminoacyl peptidase